MTGGIAPILVAAALVGVRHQVQTSTVALVLVVVVVATATAGGRLPALVSAATAALSLNFFHTQPYLRLTIDSAEDAETTVLLLVVASSPDMSPPGATPPGASSGPRSGGSTVSPT